MKKPRVTRETRQPQAVPSAKVTEEEGLSFEQQAERAQTLKNVIDAFVVTVKNMLKPLEHYVKQSDPAYWYYRLRCVINPLKLTLF